MRFESLALLQVGPKLGYEIEQLSPAVSERLPNLTPILLQPVTEINEALNSNRNQYHSTRIIAILESQTSLYAYHKILGITALDLYNPGMDGHGFVFGEARCPGRSGIVSTARLQTIDTHPKAFESRVRKEVMHEIGHMEGLKHCSNSLCVMYQSIDITDTDKKTDDYCNECSRELEGFRVE